MVQLHSGWQSNGQAVTDQPGSAQQRQYCCESGCLLYLRQRRAADIDHLSAHEIVLLVSLRYAGPSEYDDQGSNIQWVNGVTYGAANELKTVSYFNVTENRSYN